jgi:hypothetical protein
MAVIQWNPGNPESEGEPALRGYFLARLVEVKIYWQNKNRHFEVQLHGASRLNLPEHFDSLLDAKKYAEEEIITRLNNAPKV